MTLDLGGSATPDILNIAVYGLAVAGCIFAALAISSRKSWAAQLFGGFIAAIGGFLALGFGNSLIWRGIFAIQAFGVVAFCWIHASLSMMQATRIEANESWEEDL